MKNKQLKILLVDDHAVLRQGLKLLIKSWYSKAEVMEASCGEEAMKITKTNKFDIIITDQ